MLLRLLQHDEAGLVGGLALSLQLAVDRRFLRPGEPQRGIEETRQRFDDARTGLPAAAGASARRPVASEVPPFRLIGRGTPPPHIVVRDESIVANAIEIGVRILPAYRCSCGGPKPPAAARAVAWSLSRLSRRRRPTGHMPQPMPIPMPNWALAWPGVRRRKHHSHGDPEQPDEMPAGKPHRYSFGKVGTGRTNGARGYPMRILSAKSGMPPPVNRIIPDQSRYSRLLSGPDLGRDTIDPARIVAGARAARPPLSSGVPPRSAGGGRGRPARRRRPRRRRR